MPRLQVLKFRLSAVELPEKACFASYAAPEFGEAPERKVEHATLEAFAGVCPDLTVASLPWDPPSVSALLQAAPNLEVQASHPHPPRFSSSRV